MKQNLKKISVVLFALMVFFTVKLDAKADSYTYWDGWGWAIDSSESYTNNPVKVSYEVTYDYEEAYKMLEHVNKARREAGVQELILKDDLMDLAMQRAAEANIYLGHIRPDGSHFSSFSYLIYSENLHCASSTAERAFNRLKNSKGHYENMMDPLYKYVGFGCVNGTWAQVFCVEDIYQENGYDYKNPANNKPVLWDEMTAGERTNYTEIFTAEINPKLYWMELGILGMDEPQIVVGEDNPYVGNTLKLGVYLWSEYRNIAGCISLDSSEYDITCSKQLVKNGSGCLECKDAGEVTVTVSLKNYPQLKASKTFIIKENKNSNKSGKNSDSSEKNSVISRNGHQYKVTSNTKSIKTVAFFKAANKSSVTGVTIPKTITIAGKKYKVTKIAANAFKGCKYIKKVQIGSNVTSIGANAFKGCSNLKNVTVKTSKLQSVGKNALKGIHKKAVIKVPKSKLSKYKKLFKGKGQKKSVKIKK